MPTRGRPYNVMFVSSFVHESVLGIFLNNGWHRSLKIYTYIEIPQIKLTLEKREPTYSHA